MNATAIRAALTTARTNAEMGFVEAAIENIVYAGGSVGFSGAANDSAEWFCSVSIPMTANPESWFVGSKFGLIMQDALINAIAEALS